MSTSINMMDGALFRAFLIGGCNRLGLEKEEVNALNVFPVPDGDTGINMYLTVSSAAQKIANAKNDSVGKIAEDFSFGTLMGARGNSGVILSQIFRGLAVSLKNKKTISAQDLAAAMQKGVDLSYKSVMKPVEGTIITVYRLFAQAAQKAVDRNATIDEMMAYALKKGEIALADTPNQLPVLKEAGVVDAGGKGLMVFMYGAAQALLDNDINIQLQEVSTAKGPEKERAAASRSDIATADIEFTFCTQALIKGENMPIDSIRDHLMQTPPGDSLLVVGDETLIKLHFHTNQPWKVLEYCSQFGSLHDISLDNMRDQHSENMSAAELALEEQTKAEEKARRAEEKAKEPEAACGVIAVCSGEGMAQFFSDMGAYVIQGGQTMNPSAEDLLTAVNECNAREMVILPNNSNIVLTADQVKKLSKKPVEVVRSKYVTQGINAMIQFNKEASAAENQAKMTSFCSEMLNGELTYAVRDTKFNGFDIKEGDLLALMQGEIVGCCQDLTQATIDLVGKMVDAHEEAELITLYYGEDLSAEQADEIAAAVAEAYPEMDLEMECGGQPLYFFLLAVE